MARFGATDRMSSSGGPALFVLGGARSGKSRYAQKWVEERAGAQQLQPVYVATAQAFDVEMAERIDRHRQDRGAEWITVEAPLDIPSALVAEAAAGRILLVDCLTLWLSNVMLAEREVEASCEELLAALSSCGCEVALVSNEVGLSIVPDNPLGRRFRDEQGRLNQRIAEASQAVVFVAAGLPLKLK